MESYIIPPTRKFHLVDLIANVSKFLSIRKKITQIRFLLRQEIMKKYDIFFPIVKEKKKKNIKHEMNPNITDEINDRMVN